ncbi:MAG: hydrogenase nickel incorporation protein HypA [Nitrososphaeria archaeon]
MHEWALAEAVNSAAVEVGEKEGLKEITELNIRIGGLQQIDLEIFEFALSHLRAPMLKNAKINLKSEEAELKCRACEHRWSFSPKDLGQDVSESIHFIPEVAHTYLKCIECGSPDFEIVRGRGVWIESIKGVR